VTLPPSPSRRRSAIGSNDRIHGAIKELLEASFGCER
jgi:hypothetical protein